MENAKKFLFDMLVEEFNTHPSFLLARTLFLFCHFNPSFELPHDIMNKFVHGLMQDEVRAFSLMYPKRDATVEKEKTENQEDKDFGDKRREFLKERAAENLSEGTGKAYSPSMVENIVTKYRGIMSYNEILEIFIVGSAQKQTVDWEVTEFTGLMKTFPVFSPLNDSELYKLFSLLKFKRFNPDEIILRKGDPGKHLYIILTGKVEVVGDKGESISILESGSIFGEMSLLTGAPVGTSVYSRSVTKVAVLTSKDFKHVLNQYPVLHIFFYRLLFERAGKNSKILEMGINSGMSGDISEIHVVELFQLINASHKTGTVKLKFEDNEAQVHFREGEIINAQYGDLSRRRAVFALFGKTSGQFLYMPGIPKEMEKNDMLGSFMGLVMEGMQRLDEEAVF